MKLPVIEFRSSDPIIVSHWSGTLHPSATLVCDGTTHQTILVESGEVRRRWDDPLEALAWMANDIRQSDSSNERWCGYLSYDLGRLFESLPVKATDDLQLPLFAFVKGKRSEPSTILSPGSEVNPILTREMGSTFSRAEYLSAVEKSLDYIRAGDIFQVNLSQRFAVATDVSAERAFARLTQANPARYGALLQFPDFAVVSNSPELFLHVSRDGTIITRPIKGTRPNAPGMHSDLLHSIKDQAELNMIVDLERNDLGRVCRIGSVRVIKPRAIEAHPTVLHGVATVAGTLRPDVRFVDLLRATFPGGSITGAPKIRAMEIIEELEPVRRGIYCGAIGQLCPDGSMQFNLAIRTMVFKNNRAYIPVGGGIVADSIPQSEYEETLIKAHAMFASIGVRHV